MPSLYLGKRDAIVKGGWGVTDRAVGLSDQD